MNMKRLLSTVKSGVVYGEDVITIVLEIDVNLIR
jgi:hypothetical protein